MTNFFLVRHGETDWNIEGRYQGQSDVPLNPRGRAQAQRLASKLKGQSFSAIYSSDLERALETAWIISIMVGLPVKVDKRLREINQGEWEGEQVEDIKTRFADVWEQRTTDPASMRPPGGETVGEVAERVWAALDEIAKRYPEGSVIISSHGLALATVICKVRGIPLGLAYQSIPANAEPAWVEWK